MTQLELTATPVRPRVWPAVVIAVLGLSGTFVPGRFAPGTPVHFISLMGVPSLTAGVLFLWWLIASRVPLLHRLAGAVLFAAVGVGVASLSHPTMPQALLSYGLSSVTTAVAFALVVTATVPWFRRRWVVAGVMAVVAFGWTTLRVDGLDGNLTPEFSLRWSSTPEDDFLESRAAGATASVVLPKFTGPLELTDDSWPGFRGPSRDGRVLGVTFASQWGTTPPRELWRRRVGPGWSSFAVVGGLAFTQEQHGADEVVVAYALESGEEVWTHRIQERFEETVAGPGPRSTPTFDRGQLFVMGATGVLQCLQARSGEALWRRDVREDVGAKVPQWGFSSSPLTVGELVVVFSGRGDGKSVVAYDRTSGEVRWSGGDGKLGYSSAQYARLGGVEQILVTTDIGLQALEPTGGELLWEHRWELDQMVRVVQPQVVGANSVVIATGYGYGSRRLDVEVESGAWRVEPRWTSRFLKPYFNDFVVHEGYGYGFDGRIFACIDLNDGKRRWKGGRYGHGQVVALVDMSTLLVLTEDGEVALLEASPRGHAEITRFKAIEGKTWNHPVVARSKLLVRNGEEAACFELP